MVNSTDGPTSDPLADTSLAFYTSLFEDQTRRKGVVMTGYEVDFLEGQMRWFEYMVDGHDGAARWLSGMADAADALNISVQVYYSTGTGIIE